MEPLATVYSLPTEADLPGDKVLRVATWDKSDPFDTAHEFRKIGDRRECATCNNPTEVFKMFPFRTMGREIIGYFVGECDCGARLEEGRALMVRQQEGRLKEEMDVSRRLAEIHQEKVNERYKTKIERRVQDELNKMGG